MPSLGQMRGSEVASSAAAGGSVAISAMTLAEVGVGCGAAIDEAEALEAFLSKCAVLPFDEAAARAYAALPFRRGSLRPADRSPCDRIRRDPGHTNNEADFATCPV